MPDSDSTPASPSATQRATNGSHSSPAAAVSSTPPSTSRSSTPRVSTRTTVPGQPSSAITRFEPPATSSTSSPRTASTSSSSLRASTTEPAGPPRRSVVTSLSRTVGETSRMLGLDQLDGAAQVVRLRDARFGGAAVREPHRHDYHELIWIRAGVGQHSIDGATVPVRPGTITVIGRGQVHVFEEGEHLDGAGVRFSEETLAEPGARRGTPAWLLAGRGGRTVVCPAASATGSTR